MRSGWYIIVGLAFASVAHGASLFVSPATGSYAAGATVNVNVHVGSVDQSINAVSGAISFSSSQLEALSISKSGSVIGLWVEEPLFSNSDGTIVFEGVALTGFTSAQGKIITIQFKAKSAGEATLAFRSGSVLANDGIGNNVVNSMDGARFQISSGETRIVSPAPESSSRMPAAPLVSSSSHPDPEKWYADAEPVFTWKNPPGITGVNVLADRKAITDPGTRLDGIMESYSYKGVEDGVWYFHIKLKNKYGWGKTTHHKFQIDTTPPVTPTVSFPYGNTTTETRPVILFNAVDKSSGIAFYEVTIGNAQTIRLYPGDAAKSRDLHAVVVTAFDEAGNGTRAKSQFTILSIEPPAILKPPSELTERDILKIEGRSYPHASVTVRLNNNINTEKSVVTNSAGRFVILWPTYLQEGAYYLTASVVDQRGVRSLSSEPATFTVVPHILFTVAGVGITPFMAGMLGLLAGVCVIGVSIFWYRFRSF